MYKKPQEMPAVGSIPQTGAQLRLVDFCFREPITIGPENSIASTLQIMADNKIGSVIITANDTGKPIGIFTLRDVLCRIAIPQVDVLGAVETVMTRDPVSVPCTLTVAQAAHEMARRSLRHLLVTAEDGGLAGIVSRTDVYNWMCDSCASIRRTKSLKKREKSAVEVARQPDLPIGAASESGPVGATSVFG